MVYDWENKQEICSRLYIEEKRSLEEVMEYLKEHYKFTPRYVFTVHLLWKIGLESAIVALDAASHPPGHSMQSFISSATHH